MASSDFHQEGGPKTGTAEVTFFHLLSALVAVFLLLSFRSGLVTCAAKLGMVAQQF